jgi:hypothetical protein
VRGAAVLLHGSDCTSTAGSWKSDAGRVALLAERQTERAAGFLSRSFLRGEGWRMARRGLSGAREAAKADSCRAVTL